MCNNTNVFVKFKHQPYTNGYLRLLGLLGMSQHLGAEIRKILKQKGMSVSEFARRINKSRENAYSIFGRKSLDSDLLSTISLVLDHEFLKSSGSKKRNEGSSVFEQPKAAYTKMEKEIDFLREEMLHMRKEIQYLRDRILAMEGKKKSSYRK